MNLAPGAERLRVLLDTNVYISAFQYPKGRNAALWRAARDGRYWLLVSPAIIREMARVLRDDFSWQEDGIETLVRRVADVAGAGVVAPHTKVRAVTADPDDNRILECAVSGKADLTSNDHHLLDLKGYAGIPIIAAVDFRRTLGVK
ncbi:MAG: putative toxin-antitoxin system toxin component, PIN family [Bryobacteraceae bacterium]|jgi:putative PIN family toxin of toxin-antitoxin system